MRTIGAMFGLPVGDAAGALPEAEERDASVQPARVDFRDPRQAKAWVRANTEALVTKRGMARDVARRMCQDFAAARAHEAPEQPHRLGSSHVEALAALRGMDRPASVDDSTDPVELRKARNAKKRARARRSTS